MKNLFRLPASLSMRPFRLLGASIVVSLVLLATTACASNATSIADESKWAVGGEESALTNEEIATLSLDALDGSAEAAYRLSSYYVLSPADSADFERWTRIGAENGHPSAQFNYADLLLREGTHESRRRAKYWLRKAMEAGNEHAEKRLRDLGLE